jgi:hypothetical protein
MAAFRRQLLLLIALLVRVAASRLLGAPEKLSNLSFFVASDVHFGFTDLSGMGAIEKNRLAVDLMHDVVGHDFAGAFCAVGALLNRKHRVGRSIGHVLFIEIVHWNSQNKR